MLIDPKVSLWKEQWPTFTQVKALGHKIHAALADNRGKRVHKAGEEVIRHLMARNSKEAWRTLKCWYHTAEGNAVKPCCQILENHTVEREALYNNPLPGGEGGGRIPNNKRQPPMNN
jgi:hypothetical protein